MKILGSKKVVLPKLALLMDNARRSCIFSGPASVEAWFAFQADCRAPLIFICSYCVTCTSSSAWPSTPPTGCFWQQQVRASDVLPPAPTPQCWVQTFFSNGWQFGFGTWMGESLGFHYLMLEVLPQGQNTTQGNMAWGLGSRMREGYRNGGSSYWKPYLATSRGFLRKAAQSFHNQETWDLEW